MIKQDLKVKVEVLFFGENPADSTLKYVTFICQVWKMFTFYDIANQK